MDELREKLAVKKIYPVPTETILYRYSYEDVLIYLIPLTKLPLDLIIDGLSLVLKKLTQKNWWY